MRLPAMIFVAMCVLIFYDNVNALSTTVSSCPDKCVNCTQTDMLLWLTDKCRYDKFLRPNSQTINGTDMDITHVSCRIYVYFLGSIEDQNLQFTAHIVIRYRWVDSRLAHSGQDTIEGEGMLRDKVWTPHLYLVNEHESRVMGSSRPDVLVSIQPDGTVLYSTRMKVTLLCLMNLQKFPFDSQICPLVLESWAYNTSQLTLNWEGLSPVTVNRRLQLTEYSLVNYWTNSSEVVYSPPESLDDKSDDLFSSFQYHGKFSGNYSSLTVHFQLKREVGHYIMDYFMPSILLVVVSWVSFWLDPNAVPGRTTLGTSTMLTFITLSRNIGSSLPKVSYIKATEIWFIVCTAFIFGSLVEFAFVNTIWRRRKNVELKKVSSKYILKSTLTPQLKRKELNSIDRCNSLSSINESRFTSDFTINKNNSELTVNSIDSINKNPFPFERSDVDNIILQVPQNNNNQPSKGFFTMTPQEIAQWIDRRSRFAFPLSFLLFNLFYWTFVWL
ncbi:pH-sensitive chloride channel 2 isoform X2 [Nilaparvata lugens]|uniref:pH-sensitive chloride channel 2 isoform X2 n=1 Tax=Nilaparvata lugens TaxID=108931 RepID=UPI000B98A514|nr:pH-sensitive chloride channel 2 isoform X2 [Nilaparvata lugens]